MFEIVPYSNVKRFRNLLRKQITASNYIKEIRCLSTPGMAPEYLSLMWNPDVGLWAYFSPRTVKGTTWVCWFGTELPNSGTTASPSIEINISVNTSRKALAGRALIDQRGDFYLGHKGILGGGRGGQMDMVTFAANIRGFAQEIVIYPDGTEEKVYVIGKIDDALLIYNLRRFVLECERLRKVARAGTKLALAHTPKTLFDPENDRDGFGYRSSELLYQIRREHGRIVNALKIIIGPAARNGTKSFMRPDLYLEDRHGEMSLLFEVKVSPDTQSWFTAIGQLIVYGAHQKKTPRKVLVCPAIRTDINFTKTLEMLNIKFLLCEKKGRSYEFPNFDDIIDD